MSLGQKGDEAGVFNLVTSSDLDYSLDFGLSMSDSSPAVYHMSGRSLR